MSTIKRSDLFKYLVDRWCQRLKIKKPKIRKDNRFACYACIYGKDLVYTRNLDYCKLFYLIGLVFHELGHLKYGYKYNTHKEKVKDEYVAEKFMLRMLKKYYPKYYIANNIYMRNKLKNTSWRNNETKHHLEAYDKIKEYHT